MKMGFLPTKDEVDYENRTDQNVKKIQNLGFLDVEKKNKKKSLAIQ